MAYGVAVFRLPAAVERGSDSGQPHHAWLTHDDLLHQNLLTGGNHSMTACQVRARYKMQYVSSYV